jgi:hypothetical protein
MQREPLLVPCVPALLAAGTLVLGVANADNYDTSEQRTASQAAAHQVLSGAVKNPDARMLRGALPDRMTRSSDR